MIETFMQYVDNVSEKGQTDEVGGVDADSIILYV